MPDRKMDHLPKYPDKKPFVKGDSIDYSISESTEVWYGRNLWRYSMGPIGLITHRKCLLELSEKQLSLKRGGSIIFNSPIQEVRIETLYRNFGGLRLIVGGKSYTVLFYRPYYPIFSDLRVSKTTKWMQLLLSPGASGA